jgi:hypothetical protein
VYVLALFGEITWAETAFVLHLRKPHSSTGVCVCPRHSLVMPRRAYVRLIFDFSFHELEFANHSPVQHQRSKGHSLERCTGSQPLLATFALRSHTHSQQTYVNVTGTELCQGVIEGTDLMN